MIKKINITSYFNKIITNLLFKNNIKHLIKHYHTIFL